MKLTAVFLILSLHVGAGAFSQKVTISGRNMTLPQVFDVIKKQTGYSFIYSNSQLENCTPVSLHVTNSGLSEVLDLCFNNQLVTYAIVNKTIVLRFREREEVSIQQDKEAVPSSALPIKGMVTDAKGVPLEGVTVSVKGRKAYTSTDKGGNFNLDMEVRGEVLVFSYVGFGTVERKVEGDAKTVNVVLTQQQDKLEDVVLIGYGVQKKANLTGAVGMATAKRFENRPIVSAGQGLQGVIPNLNVSIRSGDPKTRSTLNVRGFESISGGSPLVLVDGVPMELDLINPDDIESVSVLKDASSAAVYGARAAFGVILVETKRGKSGLNVSLSTETALSAPILHVDQVTDSYEYASILNDVYMQNIGRVNYNAQQMENWKRYHDDPIPENEWRVVNGVLQFYGNTDFKNYMIADFAPQQKYDLSVSGATEKTSFYVSLGYLNKKGYLKNKEANLDYDRYNVLMKANFKITNWLSLDPKVVLNIESIDEPHFYHADRALNTIVRLRPNVALKFPDLPYYMKQGDRADYEQYIGMYFNGARMAPFSDLGGRDLSDGYDTWLTQGATLTPLKGLRIRGDYSHRIYNRMREAQHTRVPMVNAGNLLDLQTVYGQSADDYIQNNTDYQRYSVLNTYAEYKLDKFTDHELKLMGGFNQEWGNNQMIQARAYTLATSSVRDLNATTGSQQTAGSKSHVSLRGMFYRLNYIYKNKYLFEANGRYDLSSRFPKESRMGFFPSFSAGWRISDEKFMKATSGWIDNIMIRSSYGTLGNQLLGTNYYPYIATMGMGQRPFIFSSGQVPYVSPPALVSSELTWETVTTQNFGLDMSFFSRRLDINADAYVRKTKDMLMNKSYPVILGASAPKANAADLETKGWELSVTWRDKIGQNWGYGLNLALSDNQTSITKYENPTGALADYYVGQKIGEIWGYETVGIFQSDDEVAKAPNQSRLGAQWKAGDIRYADLNGDNIISPGSNTLSDPGDRKIIGNSAARYSFGINPEISYKNWTLNAFFQGLFRDHFPGLASHNDFWPFNADIIEKSWVADSWSVNNHDAYFPRPRYYDILSQAANFQPQTRFLQNANYIRLKNVTLNFNLSQKSIKKIGLNRAQIYLAGMNVWEFSKIRKPLDPEYIFTTTQEYFMQRTFALGAKVSF